MTAIVIRHRADLTHVQRSILDYIETRTPHRWSHCLLSARKIASAVGCSLRTVGLAVKRFASLGLVKTVSGGLLARLRDALGWRSRIRRALELTWRPAPVLALESTAVSAPNERANATPPTDPGFAPSPGLPPDPPIDASDDEELETEYGGGREPSVCEEPPPPQEVVSPPMRGTDRAERPSPARRMATPEELDRLDRAAAKIAKDPEFPQRLRRLAKGRGLRSVLAAAEIVARKVEYDEIRNPFGFVLGVLRTFAEDGVTPDPGEDPEVRTKRAWARIIEEFGG